MCGADFLFSEKGPVLYVGCQHSASRADCSLPAFPPCILHSASCHAWLDRQDARSRRMSLTLNLQCVQDDGLVAFQHFGHAGRQPERQRDACCCRHSSQRQNLQQCRFCIRQAGWMWTSLTVRFVYQRTCHHCIPRSAALLRLAAAEWEGSRRDATVTAGSGFVPNVNDAGLRL